MFIIEIIGAFMLLKKLFDAQKLLFTLNGKTSIDDEFHSWPKICEMCDLRDIENVAFYPQIRAMQTEVKGFDFDFE